MYERKVNTLLILFSAIGGIIGFVAGEVLLMLAEGSVPNVLLMGIYFGQLALWVTLFCYVAELISPKLNGKGWRLRNAGEGWKLLIPASLVLLFAAAIVLQFIYGLYFGKHKPPQDIVMAVDISGSMIDTDPDNESLNAVEALVQSLETDKRVAIVTFNDQAHVLQPLTPVSDQAMKNQVIGKLDSIGTPNGGTDIGAVLGSTIELIKSAAEEDRKGVVILISDGHSQVDLNQSLAPYKEERIAINTIGMGVENEQGNRLLKQVAGRTGGMFHKVDEVRDLSHIVGEIYRSSQTWHLAGERMGALADSIYYAAVRIASILIIGALMGLSLGIVFNNRYLARSFLIGGSIAGLISGLILEFGLQGYVLPTLAYRAAADIVLALVLSLSTAIIAYKQTPDAEVDSSFSSRSRHYGTRTLETRQGGHRQFK